MVYFKHRTRKPVYDIHLEYQGEEQARAEFRDQFKSTSLPNSYRLTASKHFVSHILVSFTTVESF